MKVTKVQIIRQALSFFVSHDYDRASLNDIAKALEITKGGIYHYFTSKDDLFYQSVIYLIDAIDSQLSDSMELGIPLEDILRSLMQLDNVADIYSELSGVDLKGEYSNVLYLMFSSMKKFPDMRPRMERIYTRYLMGMEMLFKEAQNRKEIREELNPAGLAFELSAFIEGGLLMNGICLGVDGNRMGDIVFDNFWKRIKRE